MMMKQILWVVLAMVAVLPGYAQSGGKSLKVDARFLYLRKHSDTPDEVLVMGKKGPEKIRISGRSPQGYVTLPPDGQVVLGTPGPDEKNPIIPFATGRAPSGASKVIVLLAPAPEGKYRLMMLDESKFKGGSFCFINQCGQPVGIALEDKKLLVKNRSTKLFQPNASEKARNTHISFHVGSEGEDGKMKMRLLAESIWNIDPKRGEICVFYRDEVRKRAAYKVFASYFYKPIEAESGGGSPPDGQG